jgi:hypothetical protein
VLDCTALACELRVDVTGVLGVRFAYVIQSPHLRFGWRRNTLDGRVISSAYSENDEKTRQTTSETGLCTLFSRTQKGANNNACHSHNQSKHQECTSLITLCLLVFSIHANAPTYGVARPGHLCRTMSKSKWARGNQTKKRRHTWGTEYIP